MPRVCFIINPAAGHGRAKRNWERVQPLAASLGDHVAFFTEGPMHGKMLAREAAEKGFERVAVLGGDGTLNEVGNGLVGTGAALAVVPTGTANDFVRTFPIPMDVAAAVRLVFEGTPAPIDAGLVHGGGGDRYFVNMVGAGFDAEIAGRTNDLGPWLKTFGGTLPTVVSLLITLFTYKDPDVTLEFDGQRAVVPRLVLSAVGVCRYLGGGMMLLPEAAPNDGLFDIMWGHEFGRVELLKTVAKTYKGGHVGHPRIHFARARRVSVSSAQPLYWHVDGEVGGRLPMSAEIVPGALRLVLPRGALDAS